ncbi:DUF1622 domain-containing protein [Flavobacterium sp.]|uniref:DUF1622 domain-containing protein n=1 Tax=Flavobacterium sp. TaxID=239 RepID=UPI0026221EA8|nr:DUF1622 domain-containing protein [Flavobacterium sp.]
MEDIKLYIDYIARFTEAAGIVTIVGGMAVALFRFLFIRQGITPRSYRLLRQELGKAILLGLEILVAGDIISTVVTNPTMQQVLILAVIVLIRTFLSISIEVEIEGRFPWQKRTDD